MAAHLQVSAPRVEDEAELCRHVDISLSSSYLSSTLSRRILRETAEDPWVRILKKKKAQPAGSKVGPSPVFCYQLGCANAESQCPVFSYSKTIMTLPKQKYQTDERRVGGMGKKCEGIEKYKVVATE